MRIDQGDTLPFHICPPAQALQLHASRAFVNDFHEDNAEFTTLDFS